MKFKEMSSSCDVLIVGAGGVGLALANMLTRRGIQCITVEKHPGIFMEDSKCTSTQPRSVEILDEIGILPELLDDFARIRGLVFYSRQGDRLKPYMDVTPDMFRTDCAFDYALSCPQYRIETALLEDLRKHGGDVVYSARLDTFTQDDEGVTARIADMESKETKEVRAKYLVGCDGRPSPVRTQLGIRREGSPYKDFFIISDIYIRNFNYELNKRHTFVDEKHHIHCAPLADGFFRLFVTIHDGFVQERDRQLWTGTVKPDDSAWRDTLAWFQERVSEFGLPWELHDPIRFTQYEVFLGYAVQAQTNRVLIAGDAGHSHTPHGGQGLNTGLQDVHNLAWKLAHAVKGTANDNLLATYEEERVEIWKQLVETTDSIKRVVERRSPGLRFLADKVLPHLPDAVVRNRTMVATQLWLSYDGSPLSMDQWEASGDVSSSLGKKLAELTQPSKKGDLTAPLGFRPRGGPQPGERAFDGTAQVLRDDHVARRTRLHRLMIDDKGVGIPTILVFLDQTETIHDYSMAEAMAEEVKARFPSAGIETYAIVPKGARALDARIPVVVDVEGTLAREYNTKKGGVYIVRPDRVVGYRNRRIEVDGVVDYLSGLFKKGEIREMKQAS